MRTWKPTIQSLFGLLGGAHRQSRDVDDALGLIQEAMLEALGDTGMKRFTSVSRRIQYAPDLQALWYLRGDLMAALASTQGEAAAREKVSHITEMFHGLLPGSLNSRPSPLMG